MKTALLIAVLGGILVAAIYGAASYLQHANPHFTFIPVLALTIGSVLTIALSGGLMWLVFYSARRGYDDRLPPDDAPDGPPDAPHDAPPRS